MVRELAVSGARRFLRKRRILCLAIVLVVSIGLLGYAIRTGSLTLGLLVTPGTDPPENLGFINYTISSDTSQQNPTVITIWLSNRGTSTATLSTLAIEDLNANSNPVTTFHLNQTIGPRGATAKVVVDTLTSGFYFAHGDSYKLTLSTLAGSQLGPVPASY